ncbi:hypothetical protein CK203_056760 [Vitis vinifera]|uniref:Reverse transcriptase/retrotransposon-derived protein RNase H-like domain-containing protein n=1 Tax=Vitis vinifera TaxID=29760 RepID=A0A438GKI2_VITVI|nr:hypothetical protein CK203_056760 [Vitis vinifera]
MQEVVQVEVLKLLQVGIIYPISDSPWVSPTQVVPKKSGITVVQNDKGEEILHASLQASILLFLGWLLWVFQIEIAVKIRRRPLSHVHSEPTPIEECLSAMQCTSTFQKCMLSISSDMVEHIMETWCLIGKNAISWYPKGLSLACYLKESIEVDKAKVKLIVKLPLPTTVKGVRQFLGHAGFYRRTEAMLTTVPIMRAPNWQLPFKVMCDASDFAIGAVLGQREDGKPYGLSLWFHRPLGFEILLTKQDAKARLIRWILLLQDSIFKSRTRNEWKMWWFPKQMENRAFRRTHSLLQKTIRHLANWFSLHSTPRNHPFEEETSPLAPFQPWHASEETISTLQYLVRLGQAPPLLRIHLRTLRPRLFHLLRAACPLAPLSADTRHGTTDFSTPEPLVCRIPPKRARTSGPVETSRHAQLILKPQGILSVLPTLLQKPSSRGLWSPRHPLRAIQIVEACHFHSELYFEIEAMRQQPELQDLFGLLQWYHLERLMTPMEFFYPRVAMNFY